MNQHKTCLEATYPTGRLVGKSYCGATWCYMVLAVPCFLFLSFPVHCHKSSSRAPVPAWTHAHSLTFSHPALIHSGNLWYKYLHKFAHSLYLPKNPIFTTDTKGGTTTHPGRRWLISNKELKLSPKDFHAIAPRVLARLAANPEEHFTPTSWKPKAVLTLRPEESRIKQALEFRLARIPLSSDKN